MASQGTQAKASLSRGFKKGKVCAERSQLAAAVWASRYRLAPMSVTAFKVPPNARNCVLNLLSERRRLNQDKSAGLSGVVCSPFRRGVLTFLALAV